METEQSTNNQESRQAFENQKLEAIDKVASLIMLERQGKLTTSHLNTLFTVTTGSLLEHGLVSSGQTYREIDTDYKTTDLSISAFEAQERMMLKLGVDDMGDWAATFDSKPELVAYMVLLSNEFEEKLMQILEDKELING